MKRRNHELGGNTNRNETWGTSASEKARKIIAMAAVSSVAFFGSACENKEPVTAETVGQELFDGGDRVTDLEEEMVYFGKIAELHEPLDLYAEGYFLKQVMAADFSDWDNVDITAFEEKTGIEVHNRLDAHTFDDLGEWILVETPQENGTLFVQESQADARYSVNKVAKPEAEEAIQKRRNIATDRLPLISMAHGHSVLFASKFDTPVSVDGKDVAAIAAIYHYNEASEDYPRTAADLKDTLLNKNIEMQEFIVKFADGEEVATNRDQLRYDSHDYSEDGYDIINGNRADYEDTIHRYEFAQKVMESIF